LRTVSTTLMKLLIPLALAAAVVVAAITVQPPHAPAKPVPTRSLQLHR
jgi:hypothetical protein